MGVGIPGPPPASIRGWVIEIGDVFEDKRIDSSMDTMGADVQFKQEEEVSTTAGSVPLVASSLIIIASSTPFIAHTAEPMSTQQHTHTHTHPQTHTHTHPHAHGTIVKPQMQMQQQFAPPKFTGHIVPHPQMQPHSVHHPGMPPMHGMYPPHMMQMPDMYRPMPQPVPQQNQPPNPNVPRAPPPPWLQELMAARRPSRIIAVNPTISESEQLISLKRAQDELCVGLLKAINIISNDGPIVTKLNLQQPNNPLKDLMSVIDEHALNVFEQLPPALGLMDFNKKIPFTVTQSQTSSSLHDGGTIAFTGPGDMMEDGGHMMQYALSNVPSASSGGASSGLSPMSQAVHHHGMDGMLGMQMGVNSDMMLTGFHQSLDNTSQYGQNSDVGGVMSSASSSTCRRVAADAMSAPPSTLCGGELFGESTMGDGMEHGYGHYGRYGSGSYYGGGMYPQPYMGGSYNQQMYYQYPQQSGLPFHRLSEARRKCGFDTSSDLFASKKGPAVGDRPLTPPAQGWYAKYSSGVTGVVWDRVHQAWVVSWTLGGKRTFRHFTCKSYGGFDKAREAAIEFRLARNREIAAFNKRGKSSK